MNFIYFLIIFLIVITSIFVIVADNAINSIIALINTYIYVALSLVFHGYDFFAIVFVAIYVSVISILFLFILIFLNIKYFYSFKWIERFFIICFFQFFFFYFINYFIFTELNYSLNTKNLLFITPINFFANSNSLEIISFFLYTDYFLYFVLVAIILYFVMLGSIIILQQYQYNVLLYSTYLNKE
jgi:NADH-quinone oxidoreductase subunit J